MHRCVPHPLDEQRLGTMIGTGGVDTLSRRPSALSEAAVTVHPPSAGARRSRWGADAVKELALIGALFSLYKLGRHLTQGHEGLAMANARFVHSIESQLSLPSGRAVQHWFSDGALHVANVYYVGAHFPVTLAFLVWGFTVRRRDEYLWARRLMATQTFLALILHVFVPLAPPRMFPQWGFRDTMATIGPSAYDGASATVSNQFAAMPSLHVGWAVLLAVVVGRTATRPVRLLASSHAAITFGVVIVTANHWWTDGAVAVALLGVALVLFPSPAHQGRLVTRRRTAGSGRVLAGSC